MASIYFVGPYKPIRCGIADYTSFLVNESRPGQCGVLSFDLTRYQAPLNENVTVGPEIVWYGMPEGRDLLPSTLRNGLSQVGGNFNDAVLWFQHETAIWPDTDKFIAMIETMNMPKVITFHSLHFQSEETAEGLRENEYLLLDSLLPHVQAITVFSHGVYQSVIAAFPQHVFKIHLIKHGIHSLPRISQLSRREAKNILRDFLLYDSDIPDITKEGIRKSGLFKDNQTTIIGQTGFLCPNKQSESLYSIRKHLQKTLPERRIAAVRIGAPRDHIQQQYARKLRDHQRTEGNFFLETMLPAEMLPLAQRAFDINFYWPRECTQSGILAHALGAGAVLAGREIEGVGETLNEAGAVVDRSLPRVLNHIRDLIMNPEKVERMEEDALRYAAEYTWQIQMEKHFRLANDLLFQTSQDYIYNEYPTRSYLEHHLPGDSGTYFGRGLHGAGGVFGARDKDRSD